MARYAASDEFKAAAMRRYNESLNILRSGQWRGREEATGYARCAGLRRNRVVRDLVAAGAKIEDALGATIDLPGRI